jgi:hypothetical protein
MAKRAKKRAPASISRKALTELRAAVALRAPTHDAIARRAFEIFVGRGPEDGSDVSDWLRAESELVGVAAVA